MCQIHYIFTLLLLQATLLTLVIMNIKFNNTISKCCFISIKPHADLQFIVVFILILTH
jgi:hypothetical protein